MDRNFPEYNRRYDDLRPLMDGHFTTRKRPAEFQGQSFKPRQNYTTGYSLFGRRYTQQPERPNQQEQQHQVQGQGQNQNSGHRREDDPMAGEQQQQVQADSKQNAQYSRHQYGQEPQRSQRGQYESQQNFNTQQTTTVSSSSNGNQGQGYYQGNTSSSTFVYEDDDRYKAENNTQNQSVASTDSDNQNYQPDQSYQYGSTSQPDAAQRQGYYPSNDSNENRNNTESLSYSTDEGNEELTCNDASSSNSSVNEIDFNKFRRQGKRCNQFHTGDRRGKCWRTQSSFEGESDTSGAPNDQMDYEPSSKKFCGSLEVAQNLEYVQPNVTDQPNIPGNNEMAAPSVGGIVEAAVTEADEEKVVTEAECKATSLTQNINCEESPASHDNNQVPDNAAATESPHQSLFFGVLKRFMNPANKASKKGSK